MHDLRYAFRLIRQNWGFSLTVIAILALCIGANTAVLAVVDGAMVRPLPYPEPDRLAQTGPHFCARQGVSDYVRFPRRTNLGSRSGTASPRSMPRFFPSARTESIWALKAAAFMCSSSAYRPGFFRVLGVHPLIGREFTADEDRAGGAPRRDPQPRFVAQVFPR